LSKVIVIENCEECPYFDIHDEYCTKTCMVMEDEDLENCVTFLKFCPLPNATTLHEGE
jgi:hypothetical protein